MGRTLKIGLVAALIAAAGLGITSYLNVRTNYLDREQEVCEHSSEQGGYSQSEVIGWVEREILGEEGKGISLEQLLKSGKLEKGDFVFCGDKEYDYQGEKFKFSFYVQYLGEDVFIPELNPSQDKMVDTRVKREELGKIMGFRIEPRPIKNPEYKKE